jgi:predicted DNA binding CopG/RHH family protein
LRLTEAPLYGRLPCPFGTAPSAQRGQWSRKRERAPYFRCAKAAFRKDRRLNIRLSSKDLEAIQKRALVEGLPYQTLISSLLHRLTPARLP